MKELSVSQTMTHDATGNWSRCLALGCDNAAVMTGRHKGVFAFMKKQHDQLHLAGCPCHLLHRASEKACRELPFSIDEVLVDTYYFLDKSSKRLAGLEKFQDDVKHQKILKHVTTRWLSVRKCLVRLLENWDALRKFTEEEIKSSASSLASSSSQSRLNRLQQFYRSRTNKLYCLFLVRALEPFDILNQQLQQESPQIHVLHRLLMKFLLQCLSKFVKPPAIIGKSALDVEYSQPYQIKQEKDIFVGEEAAAFIKDQNQLRESKLKEFHLCVKKFWISAADYITEKFPLRSGVLIHAKVVDIKIRAVEGSEGANSSDLEFFLDRFPCLLPAGVSKGVVMAEFAEYQCDSLSQVTDPEQRIDQIWVTIGQMKDCVGIPRFRNLAHVMLGLLTIPHSNAACERIFSCVRKKKTDQRASLGQQTLESLMVVKSLPGKAHERKYSDQELRELKSAYYNSLRSYKKN